VVSALRALAQNFGDRLQATPAGRLSSERPAKLNDPQTNTTSLDKCDTGCEPECDRLHPHVGDAGDTTANGDISAAGCSARWTSGGGGVRLENGQSRRHGPRSEAMNFRKPFYVGDLVSVHANSREDRRPRSRIISRPGAAPQ